MNVSINGRDGVGKSTQIQLLSEFNNGEVYITKPLHSYSKEWPTLSGKHFSKWWFETVAIEKLTTLIIDSLNQRYRDKAEGKIAILDRGTNMFKSVCVATWMTRCGTPLSEAVCRVDRQFASTLTSTNLEYEILLEVDNTYHVSVNRYRSLCTSTEMYTDIQNKRYVRYQKNLAEAMNHYYRERIITRVSVNASVVDIQNRLRGILNTQLGLTLPMLLQGLRLVVGYGGMSESGKSSYADLLRSSLSSYRLKIRYFIELFERFGNPATTNAVALEILRFMQTHYYVQLFSLESLHGVELPALLKILLGDRFKIVYIDTIQRLRILRAATELNLPVQKVKKILAKKDSLKCLRGATRVKKIADVVLNNSKGSLRENGTDLLCHLGL